MIEINGPKIFRSSAKFLATHWQFGMRVTTRMLAEYRYWRSLGCSPVRAIVRMRGGK